MVISLLSRVKNFRRSLGEAKHIDCFTFSGCVSVTNRSTQLSTKAKVGPQTLNLICDDGIFDDLPTKCEVKAMVSGIYITEIKSVRGKKKAAGEPKKKSFGAKMRKKQRELQNEYAREEKEREYR